MEIIVKKDNKYSLINIPESDLQNNIDCQDEVIVDFEITEEQRKYIEQWVTFTYNNWINLWNTTKIDELENEKIANKYKEDRKKEYLPIWEQLDQLYWDKINGTTTWQNTITWIKNKFPKN